MDHAVFRSWCPNCVKGKAVTFGHRRSKDKEEDKVPTISIDYMFMGDGQEEKEEKGNPILVIKDHTSKGGWGPCSTKERQGGVCD